MSGQKLQAKQKQTLQFTPQLEKSLKLLQSNQQDIEVEVNNMLTNNIMLMTANDNDLYNEPSIYEDLAASEDQAAYLDDIPEKIDADFEWDTIYDSESDIPSKSTFDGFDDSFLSSDLSFDEALESSIHLTFNKKNDLIIAQIVLENLDENYFLLATPEKISKDHEVDLPTLELVIDKIKHLAPGGVASRSIQECLLAKLHIANVYSEAIGNAHDILTDYFPYIGHKPQLIMKRLNLSNEEYAKAQQTIQQLSPYPNEKSDVAAKKYIKPDIYIHQRMGIYYASINKDVRFDLIINKEYEILSQKCKKDELHFVTSQLQEAKSFIKALDQRNQTILRVANVIVLHQQGYFQSGDIAMKPLSMKEVADSLQLHESTISRAVNGKYISFNQQLIELKYFFSKKIRTDKNNSNTWDTNDISVSYIKSKIKELIKNEDSNSPLSDTKIADALGHYSIDIARRTVAKYRESMGLENTSKRKIKI